MRNLLLIAGLLLAAATAGTSQPVRAAAFDGNWNVIIITEEGTCDRGYKYPIRIDNGAVGYAGDNDFKITGKVTANGAVSVTVRRGEQSAAGTGRLSAKSGAGTWRGKGSGGDCRGRWEAERP